MDNVTLALSSIVMIALVIMIAPNILRRNKGVALRNAALWIGIFCLLALAYKHLGPGSQLMTGPQDDPAAITDGRPMDDLPDDAGQHPTPDIDQDQGFQPPRE